MPFDPMTAARRDARAGTPARWLLFVALGVTVTCGRGPGGGRGGPGGGGDGCSAGLAACAGGCCSSPAEVCLPDLTCGVPSNGIDAGPTTCSATTPTGVCAGAATCIAGTCCDSERACGTRCCEAGSVCTGNATCAPRCTVGSDCPSSARCCALLLDPSGAPRAYGACTTSGGSTGCRCAHETDCSGAACAPRVDATGAPTRPFLCVANDCGPYRGCLGGCACGAGYCCLAGASGNAYCARACDADAACPGALCTTFTDTTRSTCAGDMACGPR